MANDPILFIKGPPVFHLPEKYRKDRDESTSIYEITTNKRMNAHVDPHFLKIKRQLEFLASPFQQQAYRPLNFKVQDEVIDGTVEKIDDDTVWIRKQLGQSIQVPIIQITEIVWRGRVFQCDE